MSKFPQFHLETAFNRISEGDSLVTVTRLYEFLKEIGVDTKKSDVEKLMDWYRGVGIETLEYSE